MAEVPLGEGRGQPAASERLGVAAPGQRAVRRALGGGGEERGAVVSAAAAVPRAAERAVEPHPGKSSQSP